MENLYKRSVYHSSTISPGWHPNPLRCHPDRSKESRLSAENRQLKTDNWLSGVPPCSIVTFTSIQHLSSQAVGLFATSPRAAAGFSLQSLTRATNERENLSFIRNFFAECPLDIYSAKASYNSADALGLLLISPERQRTDEVNLTRASVVRENIDLTRSFSAECPLDIYSANAPYNSANALALLLISPERQRTDEVNLTQASVSPLNFGL